MNKEEAIDKIIDTLPVSEMGKVYMGEILDKYADEQSREEAVKFRWDDGDYNSVSFGYIMPLIEKRYDEWKSNQKDNE